MFFKKKSLSDIFLKELSPLYVDVIGDITGIDGAFSKLYEAGVFVAAIANLKILSLEINNPHELLNEFNTKWINYICNSYSMFY